MRNTRKPSTRSDHSASTVAAALAWEPQRDAAPKVVAAGQGAIAEQILHVARKNGVPVRQDADLAQLLAAIDIDSEIPVEAFAAVAEILAYLYRANGAMPAESSSGTGPPPGEHADQSQ